jgi:hypothetical protein
MSAAPEPDSASPSDEKSEVGPSPAAPTSGVPLGRIIPKRIIVTVPPDQPAAPKRSDPPKRSDAPKRALVATTTWWLGSALIASAIGGYLLGYAQRMPAPERSPSVVEAEHAIPATEPVAPSETVPARTSMPRLTVDAVPVLRADEPAPLAISYTDADSNVSVVIDGLAPGSELGAGIPAAPNAWRLAAADLERAVVNPPRGFVGVMNLSLELRLADDTAVDRTSLQLEWSGTSAPAPTVSAEPSGASAPAPAVSAEPSGASAPTPAVSAEPSGERAPAQGVSAAPWQRRLDASEIAVLMKRGAELMASGDIVAARMILQPAAEAGEAAAAFALAETYDPSVLGKLATTGIKPDIALAQQWYEKAKMLGSTAAGERLVGFAR